MKAVILAGGRGERLRPITDTRPKPLVPILARPVMDYTLALLSHHGVREAAVTTHFLASQIKDRYGESAFGIKLFYPEEKEKLGTAGGVKNCEDFLCGKEEILVISGDAVCDFDLSAALRFHREKEAEVTIILSSVKTPLEYGVVLQDTFEKICAFSEKPDWTETFSDRVNTGVYILSPSVLRFIPQGREFDFAGDLFPLLLKEGKALYGYKDEGYWCDIGKIASLYQCNVDLLWDRCRLYAEPVGKIRESEAGRAFISDSCKVAESAEIGENSILSDGCTVESGAKVSGSLLMEGARLEKNSVCKNSVLCEEASLGEGAFVLHGSVLGKGARVEKGAVAPPATMLSAGERLDSENDGFYEEELLFTEDGICFSSGTWDSDRLSRLGAAFARVFRSRIGVMWERSDAASSYFASAFSGGVVRSGEDVLSFGGGDRELCSFAASYYGAPSVFFKKRGESVSVFAFEKDSLPLLRATTIKLARAIREKVTSPVAVGRILEKEVAEKYFLSLSRILGEGAKRRISISRGMKSSLLKKAAIQSGFFAYDGKDGETGKGLHLELFEKGMKLYLNGEKLLDTPRAGLFVIRKEIEEGRRDFVLPNTAPRIFAEEIEKSGGRVRLFSTGHTAHPEAYERQRARFERHLFDPCFLAAEVLSRIKKYSDEKLIYEIEKLPRLFVTTLHFEPERDNMPAVIRRALPLETKKVRLFPDYYGIKIISEAYSFEAALDNAFQCRGKINEIEKKLRGR